MSKTGFSNSKTPGKKTFISRFNDFRDRHRIHALATFAVFVTLLIIVSEIVPAIKEIITNRDVIQYVMLIVLIDLATVIYTSQRPETTSLAKNQDEAMQKLIETVALCKSDSVDLLEYAGATTLPLIRAIRREAVSVRILVKHPETIIGTQSKRNIMTLDTLYNSVFDNYEGKFEIRCYRLPYSLRARRLGKELLELGWLTPDDKHKTTYGHGNPSVLVDLSTRRNQYLQTFFDKTFTDLWNHEETEDGLAVLKRHVQSQLNSDNL